MKALCLGVAIAVAVFLQAPQPQIVVPCKVVSVYDGDTLTAEVTTRIQVRLLDCWAPELSDEGGPEARAKLASLAEGKQATLSVPLHDTLSKSFTFGRVLGRVHVDGVDVGEEMIRTRRATRER